MIASAVRAVIVLPADPDEMRIGGIASFVRAFVRLAPEDFDLAMIGVSAVHPPGRWRTIELEGRRLAFLPVLRTATGRRSRVPLALRFVTALWRGRRHLDLDDAILQFHRPATDLALRGHGRARTRFVHLTTEDLTQAGSESRWRRLGSVLRRFERESLSRMDRIWVVNAAAAEAYRRRWPQLAGRLEFVPNFFDDRIFGALPADDLDQLRARALSDLGLPPVSRPLLFAGRLDGQKDPELLLHSFAAVRERRRDAVLLIVGDGMLRARVERTIRSLGLTDHVRLLGTQPRARLSELMSVASLLVITSHYETGPTVGYEALASGLPVVTTDVGEIAGIVRRGTVGAVAARRDPESVADAISASLDLDPATLRARAREAASPFAASSTLGPIYDWHRRAAAPD